MSSPVSRRLTQAMAAEVQNFIYRPRLTQEIASSFDHVVDINQAHTIMLAEQRIIAAATAASLAQALISIERDGAASVHADPAREDVHFNFEAALIERTSPQIGGGLHVGRSRNDMGATIDRMRARAACLELRAELNRVRTVLLQQAQLHADTVMSGYTHLRPAQPVTFGFYLLGIAGALQRDYRRLCNAYETINMSPMGAAALAGTSFAIDRERVAALLGFQSLVEHAQDAVASRDFLLELGSACVTLGITWSRLAQDLYVWSTDEFGLVAFSDQVSGSSSIMPQKKNPVVMEFLKATGAENIGSLVATLSMMRASHFTNSIDAVRSSTAGVWQLLDTTYRSLAITRVMLDSCRPDRERMLQQARSNFSTITDVADLLVKQCELAFREAHHVAGTAVRIALERGLDASQIGAEILENAAEIALGRKLAIPADLTSSCSDPNASIRQRKSRGAASPSEIARMQLAAADALARDDGQLQSQTRALEDARGRLKQAIQALALRS
ncbi:MAG: argininosuccinate lyase [Proteobacteria bacterium]|nr:argininosuccinate lyase [Pseudomonadota bacterium]